ncbi:MAG: hypothetical protein AVDCRST_MAG07-1313 [uncultured Frankineae bacterium]|uniref:Uncharacterized protein n=1 Tax=uncultured Frankineae bacterium TaxID=437475 RepID=A0A6J4L711_9ACTN|nr:MAG: hypothetical protein AVDCRST_MAG07-1313 [uncultured Frankineae bacterium]
MPEPDDEGEDVVRVAEQPTDGRVHLQEVREVPEDVELAERRGVCGHPGVRVPSGEPSDRGRGSGADQVQVQVDLGQGPQLVVRDRRPRPGDCRLVLRPAVGVRVSHDASCEEAPFIRDAPSVADRVRRSAPRSARRSYEPPVTVGRPVRRGAHCLVSMGASGGPDGRPTPVDAWCVAPTPAGATPTAPRPARTGPRRHPPRTLAGRLARPQNRNPGMTAIHRGDHDRIHASRRVSRAWH